MKIYLLIIIGCLFALNVSGQYNYYRLSAGVGLGVNTAFTDLEKTRYNQSIIGNLDYNLTPFVSAGLEVQKGTLSGGDKELDPHGRFFKNSYMAFTVNGKAQLGQFVDFESSNFLYAVRGLYVGTGVGIIQNKMTDNVRQRADGHIFTGDDKSSNIAIPINTGINFNILDRWGYTRYILNLNYQMNVTIGEGLDGYNDSAAKFKNQYPDFYSVFSAGIKICFGPEGLY
ncbi:hypothetical protein [Desertivirga xinjiangensis]|uniref:hypothetical protein n=1 Tax=Desertivirga xinjiangensis TaxID=539206 RepID=UPI00210F1C5D|nr:hypothetical protein [Pedobacter xinjiangensis]